MDRNQILTELRQERAHIDDAIRVLEPLTLPAPANLPPARPAPVNIGDFKPRKKHKGMTAEGRAKMSQMMKARWAKIKKAA